MVVTSLVPSTKALTMQTQCVETPIKGLTVKVGCHAILFPECKLVIVHEIYGKHAVCSLLGDPFEFQVDLDDLIP